MIARDMLKTSKNGIIYLSSGLFPEGIVTHAFLGRLGGVSAPPFDTLNFDDRDTDTAPNIAENRKRIERAFSIDERALATVNQVHGNTVFLLDEKTKNTRVDADAIITRLKEVPIGIFTADCQPILIHDPVRKAAGAVHAGWKGTVLKVVRETIGAMKENFGSNPDDLVAALGPCIGPCCYAIKDDVALEFLIAVNALLGTSFKLSQFGNTFPGQFRLCHGRASPALKIMAGS